MNTGRTQLAQFFQRKAFFFFFVSCIPELNNNAGCYNSFKKMYGTNQSAILSGIVIKGTQQDRISHNECKDTDKRKPLTL